VAGIVLLTLGALIAFPAMAIDSCTQGGADSLRLGLVVLLLYALGGAALVARPPRPVLFLALVPAAGLALLPSVFAFRFALAIWSAGVSACDAMAGTFEAGQGTFPSDGGEAWLAPLWVLLSLVFWLAAAAGFLRSRAAAARRKAERGD
jgi:hypothetical protein